MNSRANPWKWITAAAVASAVAAMAEFATARDFDHGLRAAAAAVARVAFVPFWLTYAGGAFAALGVRAMQAVRDRAREFGLAFAAAITIHLGLIGWLAVRGYPPSRRIDLIFGAAALLTLLLTALSIPAIYQRISRPGLARFRALATTYIALVYLLDFGIPPQPAALHYWLAYFSFFALDLAALGARLLAWMRDAWRPWRVRARAQ